MFFTFLIIIFEFLTKLKKEKKIKTSFFKKVR